MPRLAPLALALLLAACSAAPDPADAPRAISPLMLEPPPIYALLGFRQDLALTSPQVTALDSIAESIRGENAPLIAEIEEKGREASGRYRNVILVDSVTEPLLERLRAQNRRAAEGVGEVLGPEQEATACRLFDQARDRRREAIERQGGRDRQSPQTGVPYGEPGDSLLPRSGRTVWPWCGAPAGARTDTLYRFPSALGGTLPR